MTVRKFNGGIIAAYRDKLPIPPDAEAIHINEGDTPLVHLPAVSDRKRNIHVYAKCEGLNPTGSFKDRGMTVALSMASHSDSKAVQAFVVIPADKIALGKLAQAMMHGAKVVQIGGNFDDAMEIVKRIPEEAEVTLVNSVNPFRLQGQKTAAFEVVDELGSAPDYHFLPVGNAGNISAYWMGYVEYVDAGITDAKPRMVGCQATGAAPFLAGAPIEEPETIATAIRIGNPQSWNLAHTAVIESNGWFRGSDDEQILLAQKMLADRCGIFCEPASAVAIAGFCDEMEKGNIQDDSVVVCTLTGHGLKDPDIAIGKSPEPITIPKGGEGLRDLILSSID